MTKRENSLSNLVYREKVAWEVGSLPFTQVSLVSLCGALD